MLSQSAMGVPWPVRHIRDMKTYRDLKVWQAGYEVALELHRDVRTFPMEERFEMSRDLRRTSRSVIYNITEGSGRRTAKQQIHFLNIAAGSASELECQVLLSGDLGLLPRPRVEEYLARIAAIRRMLYGMMEAVARETTSKAARKRSR